MSDVTGPISSLPGSFHQTPAGTMCDTHRGRPAVRRVQGETDSLGSEMLDLCQECMDKIKEHEAEARRGYCDWCKTEQTTLADHRDFEEGSCGPVYRVCAGCRKKESDSLIDEIQRHDEDDEYY